MNKINLKNRNINLCSLFLGGLQLILTFGNYQEKKICEKETKLF